MHAARILCNYGKHKQVREVRVLHQYLQTTSRNRSAVGPPYLPHTPRWKPSIL